MRNFWMSLTIM